MSSEDTGINVLPPREVSARIAMGQVDRLFSKIVGDVLTIIDASVSDSSQREAIKSLIKKDVYQTADKLGLWIQTNQEGSKMGSSFPI